MPSGSTKNQKPAPKVSVYTTKLDSLQMHSLYNLCTARDFERYDVAYAHFAFRASGLNVVAYQSGKVVIQGRRTEEFVQFELEPNVTFNATLGYDSVTHPEWFEEHAGMDESGKGDLFGPLVTACVIAGGDTVQNWIDIGVKDSKSISSEKAIFALESKILASDCETSVSYASMPKYNELYAQFGSNMNFLLGWMHACSLKNALQKRPVSWGMLDQFSRRPIVQSYLKREDFDLRMQTKAESDPVVAAASILARAEYSRQMDRLSKDAGFRISKGAGKLTIEQAKEIARKFGHEKLNNFCKMHFSTVPKTE